jgi:hypothetical protein
MERNSESGRFQKVKIGRGKNFFNFIGRGIWKVLKFIMSVVVSIISFISRVLFGVAIILAVCTGVFYYASVEHPEMVTDFMASFNELAPAPIMENIPSVSVQQFYTVNIAGNGNVNKRFAFFGQPVVKLRGSNGNIDIRSDGKLKAKFFVKDGLHGTVFQVVDLSEPLDLKYPGSYKFNGGPISGSFQTVANSDDGLSIRNFQLTMTMKAYNNILE